MKSPMVVVDVDDVDVLPVTAAMDQVGQWLEDVGDAVHQLFGIGVPVGVEHVDDEDCGICHPPEIPVRGRLKRVFFGRRTGTATTVERSVPMPKTTRQGKPKKDELPSTIRKSDAKAAAHVHQRRTMRRPTNTVKANGAHRTACAAASSTATRRSGTTGAQAISVGLSTTGRAAAVRNAKGDTAEGVDANASKKATLQEIGKRRLDIRAAPRAEGKDELVDAAQRANRRATRAGWGLRPPPPERSL